VSEYSTIHFAGTFKELESSIRKEFDRKKIALVIFKTDETTCRVASYRRHKIRLSKAVSLESRILTMNMYSLKQIILTIPKVKKGLGEVFWVAVAALKGDKKE